MNNQKQNTETNGLNKEIEDICEKGETKEHQMTIDSHKSNQYVTEMHNHTM